MNEGNFDRSQLLADLRRDEGCRLQAYRDSEGWLTIGFGRLIDAGAGGGISMAEAELLLANDVDKFIGELDRRLSWWRDLPAPAQLALANMAFNLGLTRLLKFKKMLAALRAGDFTAAAAEALNSKWAGQVGAGRSGRIADLYRSAGAAG